MAQPCYGTRRRWLKEDKEDKAMQVKKGWTRIWIIRLDKVLSRKVVLCFLPALDYLYGRSSWPTPTPRGGGEQLIQ